MAKKIIRLTESQLRNIIKETIHNLMEYNDSFMDKVAKCNFLSDEDKKKVQVASMNNWDRHEREAKKAKEMKDMEAYSNPNIEDKHLGYVGESKRHINEAFNSNQLRQWFKSHGGVNKQVGQDGLGDVSNDMIVFSAEFDNFNDASRKLYHLKQSNRGMRSEIDMKAYLTIYQANDGTCLLVGIDRKQMPTSPTWGGERTKKSADRVMNNGWNHKTRSTKYADDSDTYYYSRKGKDFGIYDNHKFQGKKQDNQRIKSQMSDDEWNDYMKNRTQGMKDYLNRHYPKD